MPHVLSDSYGPGLLLQPCHAVNQGNPVPTRDEWEQQKDLITMLYLYENRTLKEVMEYMKLHHSFHAT